jgi:hypothetical protein
LPDNSLFLRRGGIAPFRKLRSADTQILISPTGLEPRPGNPTSLTRASLMEAAASLPGAAPRELVVTELSTLGGDPEVARMMGEDVRYHSEHDGDRRRFAFLGKAAIYSAGTTFMSFFTVENRYLTRGTRLMVHERRMTKTLSIDGPLTSCIASVKGTLNELEASIAIQNEGFENLVRGSRVSSAEVFRRAASNWYIEANEALRLNLVAGIV